MTSRRYGAHCDEGIIPLWSFVALFFPSSWITVHVTVEKKQKEEQRPNKKKKKEEKKKRRSIDAHMK